MKENINRCRFSNVECLIKDMTVYDSDFDGEFDRVLIDAPCSGIGVAGKRPEIKLKFESAESLIRTQQALISICSRYVKKGGILVYGTCTVNRMENQNIVEEFLERNNDYILNEDFTDKGFYAARIIKK